MYQGYSKLQSRAYTFIKYFDSDEVFEWKQVNHYYAPIFYLWVGFDPFNSGWVG